MVFIHLVIFTKIVKSRFSQKKLLTDSHRKEEIQKDSRQFSQIKISVYE